MAAKPAFVHGQRNSQPPDTSVANRSVLVKNLSPSTSMEAIIIYFQRRKNGGGEVDDVCLLSEGAAVVTFDKAEVAESVLTRLHNIDGVQVTVERNVQTYQVFGKVAGRLDPHALGLSFSNLEEILHSIKDETGVEWRRMFDGFVVSGTFEQIGRVHSLLQKIKPIKVDQEKRRIVQRDNKKSVYDDPWAIGQSPQIGKPVTERAKGPKPPDIESSFPGKANLRKCIGRGLSYRMNTVNGKEMNKGEVKLRNLKSSSHGFLVPPFDFPGARSTLSIERKHELEKTEPGRSKGENQCQANTLREEEVIMSTARSKWKTVEARKIEDESKISQSRGVSEQRPSREEASKFSDLGSPQIMTQSNTRPGGIDDKDIDTRNETSIQKVTNKEMDEKSQGTTTESFVMKKIVVGDSNERTDNTAMVTGKINNDALGSASQPTSYPHGTEIWSNNQNQDERDPFETLSRKQHDDNNGLRDVGEKTDSASQPASFSHDTESGSDHQIQDETKPYEAPPENQYEDENSRLRNVKEKENAFLENEGEAAGNHRKDEKSLIEALQKNEMCKEIPNPQPKSPNPDESIEDLESLTIVMKSIPIKFSTETNITVILLQGDVTSHNADVLISPAHPSLCCKEGLSKQIQDRGGRPVKEECLMKTQGQKTLKYGETYFTNSGSLPCKAILHVILPQWTDDKEDKRKLKRQIHDCLKNGLLLASGHRHRSVAFPPLGQEWNPIPDHVSAEVITRVIAEYSRDIRPLHSGVTDIHIVCEDEASFKLFAKELEEFSFRHKQQKHFVTKSKLCEDNKAEANDNTRRSSNGQIKDEHSTPKEMSCQSATFPISSKLDSVPEKGSETTQMVSPKEQILTSSFEIKQGEELAAVDEEMTTIEVDDFSQPMEARAFEVLEPTSGRRLIQVVGDVSKSVSDEKSLKREMAEEFQRDEFEEKVNESHDFEKKYSLQLQQSTAVGPFLGKEEMGQNHTHRSIRHTNYQKPPPLSIGKNTIIRRGSNSSSLHNDGRVLEGFTSPTIEALMNADLHLGAQGLTLLHDDDEKMTEPEDQEEHEESYLLDLHDENYSTAPSVPRSNEVQNNGNMPHDSRGKDEKIFVSNMELGTPHILETTDKNSSSLSSKYDEKGSQTLSEKNGKILTQMSSAETAKLQSASTLCALCQEAMDQRALENSNACEEHKFCDDCNQRAFSFSDECPACVDAYGLINPERVGNVMQRRRSDLDAEVPLVEHLSSTYKSVSPQGNQPPGQIMWKKYAKDIDGFKDYGTIVVNFIFYDGVQSPEHPNPGRSYKGISCVAYFPDTQEGKQVLKLLRRAFDARLVFTVSQNAADESGQVVLDGLELKTTAESYLRNGQPDVDYFARLKGQLAAKGII